MSQSNNIRIKNLYYLLSYAFQALKEDNFKNVGTESFERSADLCAAILIRGMSAQVKQGLHREYISETDSISSIKGRIDIQQSLITTKLNRKVVCTFDEYSIDNALNQILKSTCNLLIVSDIEKERKIAIKKLLVYFQEVSDVDLRTINWNVQYNRNNRTYQMLIAVCFLVFKGLLQTTSEGNTYLMDFVDEQRMCYIYQRFLLEYYKVHWSHVLKVSAPKIAWQLDNESSDYQLPEMKSDAVLQRNGDYLIIDAKYYTKNTQEYQGKTTINSDNLFQMYAYVKNKEEELRRTAPTHSVSGLILYAMTDADVQPNASFSLTGNRIAAHTLDLNTDWTEIRKQLDRIVTDFFPDIS